MAQMGDIVTKLIADSSQFTAGTDRAIAGNKGLSGSIDSMIGQLMRQKKAFDEAGKSRSDQIRGTAERGAPQEKIEHALDLNSQVEAAAAKQRAKAAGDSLVATLKDERDTLGMNNAELRRYRAEQAGATEADLKAASALEAEIAARVEKNRAIAAGKNLINSLSDTRDTFGMSPDEITIHRARQSGASESDINRARELQREVEELQKAQQAEDDATAAKRRAQQAGKDLIDTVRREADTYGMTASEIRRYDAAQRGATAADIRASQEIEWKTQQQERFDREIQKQINSQRQAQAAAGGTSRSTMLLAESMRGLEDATMGFTNNGLKGLAMGLSNNISQIGSLMGGPWGTGLMIGSNAALIGTTLVPMLSKWASGTDEIIKKEKELQDELQRTHQAAMSSLPERARSSFRKQDEDLENRRLINDPTATSSQLQAEQDRVEKRRRDAVREQGIEKSLQDEMRKRQFANQQELGFEAMAGTPKSEKALALEKENAEIERKMKESADRIKTLKADEITATRQLEETDMARRIRQGQEMHRAEMLEAEREKKEWLTLRKERAEKDKKLRGDAGGVMMDLLRKENPQMADEIEGKRRADEQREQLSLARDRGLISQREFDTVSGMLDRPQDRGAELTRDDGSSGFQSADIKTSAGFNAAIKAINYAQANNDPVVKATKESADQLAEILERIDGKMTNTAQVATLDF